MRIHTDRITELDIHVATNAAGMRDVFADVTQRGSRSRERSFDVKLTGNSTRKTNPGWANGEREQAATWDEWGMFIHALYQIDPEAVIGQYADFEVFQTSTGHRFDSLTAPYSHGEGGHRWIVSTPGVQECVSCDATFRYDYVRTARLASKVSA